MKKNTILILLFTCCACLKGFSQLRDSLDKIYNNQTIYQCKNRYMMGNQFLSYHELRQQFNTPVSIQLYQESKNKKFVSKLFNGASLALLITSVFTKTNVGGSISFATGTGLLGLAGIYYQNQSKDLTEKAIWIRNGNVLFGPQ